MWFSDLGNAKRKTLRTNGSEEMGIRLIAGNEIKPHPHVWSRLHSHVQKIFNFLTKTTNKLQAFYESSTSRRRHHECDC